MLVASYARLEEEAANTFENSLKRQIEGTLPAGYVHKLGLPGAILRSVGVPNMPINLAASRLAEKANNHDYTLDELSGLVDAINNPIAVFARGKGDDVARDLIVEIEHNGKNFVVGLYLNPVVGGQRLEINSIRTVYPKDTGIDALLVDEAHSYKHLGFSTAMQRGVKGVDSTGSKKSAGVYLKTRAVFDKAGWKNVIFATGTPISNTAAEIWTFMKYLMPDDMMRQNHIYYFDDFVRNFGNIAQSLEFTTSGKFKENTRFASYTNLPELIRIWWSVCDTVRSEDAVAEGGEKLEDKQPKMENWTGADGREHVNQARDIYMFRSGTSMSMIPRKRTSRGSSEARSTTSASRRISANSPQAVSASSSQPVARWITAARHFASGL